MLKTKRFFLPLMCIVMLLSTVSGTFTVWAASSVVNETESNNTYTEANTIPSGSSISANLSSASDNDYFKVTPSRNGKLTFTFEHEFYDNDKAWDLNYYRRNSDGTYSILFSQTVFRNSAEKITSIPISVIENTIYVFRVSRRNGCTDPSTAVGVQYKVSYSFEATEYYERENNNTFNEATIIPESKKIEGNLYTAGDNDYFKVTPSYNGKLTFTFEHEFYDNDKAWDVTYYRRNSDGTYSTLFSQTVFRNSSDKITSIPISVLKSNIYVIRVSRRNGCTDPSTAVGVQYKVSYSFEATEYYEREYNNTYTEATLIPASKEIEGNLHTAGDNDYYYCTPKTNGKLSFVFKHGFVDSSKAWDVTGYIKDEEGKYSQIISQTVYLNSSETVTLLPIGAKANTTYCIKISRREGCTDPSTAVGYQYRVSYSFESTEYFEREFNNSYAAANTLPSGVAFGGVLIGDESDFYTFVSEKTGQITLDFGHPYYNNTKGWSINIYEKNSDGTYSNLNKTDVLQNSKETVSINFNVKSGSTYCVKVTKREGYTTSILTSDVYSLKCDYAVAQVDNTKPTASISSTNNAASSQTATLSMSDNVGLAGYYWGTSSTYSSNTYTSLSGASYSTTKSISSAGTYYLTAKDTSGNISSTASKTFYKTTLNANSGSVSPSSVITMSGNSFNLPTPTRSGYTFKNWNTNSAGTGTPYSAGTAYKPTANVTLYAQWIKNDAALQSISVKTLPSKTTYTVGDTLNTSGLVLTAKYSDGSTKDITSGFTCSPTKLSTAGKQTITVTYSGKTTTFSVTVNNTTQGKVKSVKINDISLNYKASTTLKPTIQADSGVKYTVKYESSNTKVATVDGSGKVTATKRGSGSATITCTVTDQYGNVVKDTCTVNVSLSFGQKIIVYVLFGWIWY